MSSRIRAYNIFYFAALCIFISFLPVYFAVRGVPATHIGWLVGMGSFIGIIAQPLWGMVSDRLRTVRKIILLTLALSLAVGVLLFRSSGLPLLYLLTALCYFFFLPTDPLTESLNYRWAEQHGSSFGAIRMYGAVGYAGASLVTGYVAPLFGDAGYSWFFLTFGGAALAVCWTLPDVAPAPRTIQFAQLRAFLREPKTLRFFLLVLIAAIPHRTNDSFLGVYLHSMGASTFQVGLAWFLGAVSETALFACAPRLLSGGKELRLISVAALLYVVRYVAMALLPDPRWVMLLQLMQGVTFVFFYTASIQYLYGLIPVEWRATGQTILAVLFFGISGIVGSSIGGWLFDLLGGPALYLSMAGMSAVAFLFSLTR